MVADELPVSKDNYVVSAEKLLAGVQLQLYPFSGSWRDTYAWMRAISIDHDSYKLFRWRIAKVALVSSDAVFMGAETGSIQVIDAAYNIAMASYELLHQSVDQHDTVGHDWSFGRDLFESVDDWFEVPIEVARKIAEKGAETLQDASDADLRHMLG